MNKLAHMLALWIIFIPTVAIEASEWTLDEQVDPLTDDRVTTARSSYSAGPTTRWAVIRCTGTRLEAYFDFDVFLDRDPVSVRYRIDREPLAEEKWLASADGTSVFANEDADLARQLISGSSLVIEARDYRGQSYRANFDVSNARSIRAVLENCGLSLRGLAARVAGLRPEIGLELERWGPKNISVNKRVLASLGVYKGPQDTVIDADFAIAVQRVYDSYVSRCKSGHFTGGMCTSMLISWNAGMEPLMPSASTVLYELTPARLKQESGNLRIGD